MRDVVDSHVIAKVRSGFSGINDFFHLMTKINGTPHVWLFYKQSKMNFIEHWLWSRWLPVVFYLGMPQFLHNTLHSLCFSRCICSFQEFRTCFGTYWIGTTLNLLMMKSEHSHECPSLATFGSAMCDRDMFHLNTTSLKTVTSPLLILHAEDDNIIPHHMALKVVSILFHFLLRVASSLFGISFPSPAVPDITPGQEDRCPGWNDLLQREAWILPQRHLLGSQSVKRGRVRFVWSEPTLRNAHAITIGPKRLHVDVPDSCRL